MSKVFIVTQGSGETFQVAAVSLEMALQRVADICCLKVSELYTEHIKDEFGPGEDGWYVHNMFGFEIRERQVLGS